MPINIYDKLRSAFSGPIIDANVVEVDGENINNVDTITNAQLTAESLQNQIINIRQSQEINSGNFQTFENSFVIDDTNASANNGVVNIYVSPTDKITTVTLPSTADIATAGLTYPVSFEFIHTGGTGSFTRTNILRIQSADAVSGNLIDAPNEDSNRTFFNLVQNDIGLFVKDNAGADYRLILGTFDAMSQVSRGGVFTFRDDISITNIVDIATELAGVTINQGDAFIITNGGPYFNQDIVDGSVIVAKINNPSLLSTSTDWLILQSERGSALSSNQMAFFRNIIRDGTRFDFTRNINIDPINVIEFFSQATGSNLGSQYLYRAAAGESASSARSAVVANQNIQFSDLIGGRLRLQVQFTTIITSGFLPQLVDLRLTYGAIEFVFPLTGVSNSQTATVEIDIPNINYSSILNTNCTVTLNFNFTGRSFSGVFRVQEVVNRLKGNLNDAVTAIAEDQAQMAENRLDERLRLLATNIDNEESEFEAIRNRISPLRTDNILSPDINALFLNSTGSDPFPTSLASFNEVNSDNPRFTGGNVALFVAVISDGVNSHALRNITTSSSIVLVDSDPNVTLGESLSNGLNTYFVYRITGLTSGHVYEIDEIRQVQIVAWPADISALQQEIVRIDSELSHAALNLDDELVHYLENDIAITEETTPTINSTAYNNGLGDTGTQTVFYETNPNTPSGGFLNSKPIIDTNGTDRYRRKLVYFPPNDSYSNQAYLVAFDGTTGRDLIRYLEGDFYVRQFIPAVAGGTQLVNIYPTPENQVFNPNNPWFTISTITFQNGVPIPLTNELFFTRNIPPSSTFLFIDYRGHANGNVFGTSSTILNGAGGNTSVSLSFTLNDGNESATVEVLYRATQRDIRVSVTERISTGLPTINDIQIRLRWSETRTIPATPASTRDILIESLHSGYNIFAIKPSATNTLVIVGDQVEIDTRYPYTTLFGGGETGYLRARDETTPDPVYLDYEDFDVIPSVIIDLENHATLPQYGLFTTNYTHETSIDFDTQMTVRDDNDNEVNVGTELVLKSPNGTYYRLSVDNDGNLITTVV